MKIIFKFLVFFTYLILIFFLEVNSVFVILLAAELLVMKIFKISFKNFFKTIIILLPFLLVTFVCNLAWGDLNIAITILARLILAYIVTYIFSSITPTVQIIKFVEIITMPLKIFKVDSRKAGLVVGIAVSMIPVLKDEIEQKIYALNSKGYKFKLNELDIIFKPIFISILRRTGEIEKNLISKGYQE